MSVSPAKRKSSVKPADSESEEERPAKRAAAGKAKRLVDSDDSEDDFKPVKKPAAKPASKGRKRVSLSRLVL